MVKFVWRKYRSRSERFMNSYSNEIWFTFPSCIDAILQQNETKTKPFPDHFYLHVNAAEYKKGHFKCRSDLLICIN